MTRLLALLLLISLPQASLAVGGVFPVPRGARPGYLPPPPAAGQPVDVAALEERTRVQEERLLLAGRSGPALSSGEFGRELAAARREADAGGDDRLEAASARIGGVRQVLARQAEALRARLLAARRVAAGPHADAVRSQVERDLHLLDERLGAVSGELDSVEEGLDDQRGGLWGRFKHLVRSLLGRDPASRLAGLDGQLGEWGAPWRPQVLGATTSNDGLTYVTWAEARSALPSALAAPAYLTGAIGARLEDASQDQETTLPTELLEQTASLGSAAAILDYVKNELRLEWYRGCLKGAAETLRQRGGNDADLAALTIALLRSRGVAARYVYGTIELPVAKVADLMGLLDAAGLSAAAAPGWSPPEAISSIVTRVLEASGTPFEPVVAGGRVRSLRLGHVWVEAFLAFGDYRGTGRETGPRAWVPIDPSITGGPKYELVPAAVDLLGVTPGGVDGLIDSYLSAADGASPLERFRAAAQPLLAARSLTYEQALRRVVARPERLGLVPGSLPYQVVGVQGEYVNLPDQLKHLARIRVSDAAGTLLEAELPIHQLAGARVALLHEPATQADADLIAVAGSLWEAPASVVQVLAALRVNGAAVARAARPSGLGAPTTVTVEIADAGGLVRRVSNPLVAGNLVALGFGTPRNGYVEGPVFLEGDDDGAAVRFDAAQIAVYAEAWGRDEAELASALQVLRIHPTANVAFYQSQLQVEELLGIRLRVRWMGLAIDADLRPMVPVELVPGRARDLFRLSGYQGSFLEAATLSAGLGGVPSVSTVSLFQAARAGGVPILEVTPANAAVLLPHLEADAAARDEVAQHLAHGRTVWITARPMTVFDWTGSGWIALDTATGEGGYFLSGALSGAVTVLSTIKWAEQAQQFVQAHQDPTVGQVVAWANAVDRVAVVAKVQSTDLTSVEVGKVLSQPLTVVVLAQWGVKECVEFNPNGTCKRKETVTKAARVKGAPVTFTRFNGAEFAFGGTVNALASLFQGTPEQVTAAVHAAAHQTSAGAGPAGEVMIPTGDDGYARVYVAPDPIIGNGITGVMPQGPNGSSPSLVGNMQAMATVKGARPHGTDSYDLRLVEPFSVFATPGPTSEVRAEGWGANLLGAIGGIEFATPLVARVVDAFGNTLSGKEVKWEDPGGGRFVNPAALGAAGTWSGLAPKLFDPADASQANPWKQVTGPYLPIQVAYIPPYGGQAATVTATCDGKERVFRISLDQDEYYFAVKMDRTSFNDGVTGTWFSSPIAGIVYHREASGWAPLRPGDAGTSQVSVTANTYGSADGALLEAKSTDDGSLTFDSSKRVQVRPKYLVDGAGQSTTLEATVLDDKGKRVCCGSSWYTPARASRVKLEFARMSSVLDTVPISGDTPGRTTDRRLAVTVVNPSEQKIYVKVNQPPEAILSTDLGAGPPAGGLTPVGPGTNRLEFPIVRTGGDLPGGWTGYPAAGDTSFEVWGNNKTDTPTPGKAELLSQAVSVNHAMTSLGGATGDAAGTARVGFVGGWNCTYFVNDKLFKCTSEVNKDEVISRGYAGDPSTP